MCDVIITLIEGFLVEKPLYQPKRRTKSVPCIETQYIVYTMCHYSFDVVLANMVPTVWRLALFLNFDFQADLK